MENQPENKPVVNPPTETLESAAVNETSPPPTISDSSPTPPATTPAPEADAPIKDKHPRRRLGESKRLYAWIFLIVVIIAGGIIYATLRWSKGGDNPQSTKTQSLSAKQLAALANNSTTVGDAKQTLDVQSNAVFEGQVLLRQGLEVAGTLKVGGALSLPSINVGGTGNFGQLQVSDKLSVAGDSVIQGQLSIQKNLTVAGSATFGNLSASQLNVTSLQLSGDLTVSRHIAASGGVPGSSNGSALGSGGTVSISGSDTAGTVTINTGGGPPAGCFITVNFVQKFSTTPRVILSASNSSAGSLSYYANRTSGSFSVCSASAPAAATNYIFDYFVVD